MRIRIFQLVIFLFAAITPVTASDIEGQVRAISGSVTRGTVQLFREGLPVEDRLIGANGRFEFHNLNPGSYSIRINADGFSDEETPVLLSRNNSREFVMIDVHPVDRPLDTQKGAISVTQYQIPRAAKREFDRGLDDRQHGRCEKAIPHLHKAIAIFEKYSDAFNELGHCFKQLQDFSKAEESFKKAVEYSTTVYPTINLADLYETVKRLEDSEAVLQQSLRKYPAEGDLDFAMARLRFGQGRVNEAEESGLRAHSKTHRLADVHLLLAKIYSTLGKYAVAVTELQTYLSENPKGPTADLVRKNLSELQKQ